MPVTRHERRSGRVAAAVRSVVGARRDDDVGERGVGGGRGAGVDRRGLGPRSLAARVAPAATRRPLGGAVVAEPLVRSRPAGLGRRRRPRRAAGRRRGRDPGRRRHDAGWPDDPHPRPRRRARAVPRPAAHRRAHLVPAVQRTRRRVRPRRPDDDGSTRRGPLDRQRAEGLEHIGPPRRLRHPRRPDELGRPEASRAVVLRAADAPAGRRGATAATDELPRLVQRGVHVRRRDPRRSPRRRGGQRLGGGPDHAGVRAPLRRAHATAPAVRGAGTGGR